MRKTVRRFLVPAFAALALLFCARAALAADSVTVVPATGYGRLLFALTQGDQVTAQASGSVLTLAFSRKVDIAPDTIVQTLPAYFDSGRVDPDGKTFHFALKQPVRVHTSASAGKIAVDLAPQSYAGTMPDLPPPPPPPRTAVDPASLPVLKVRSGSYHDYTRLVFDWPSNVPYAVFTGAGKLTVRFEALANPDFSAITRQMPPWLKTVGWHIENKGTVVDLAIDVASGHHDFRDGTHVVIDILAPKTDADAFKASASAKPAPPAKPVSGATTAQVQAIQNAAAKLNGTAVATGAPAKLTTPEPPKPAPAPPPAPQPPAASLPPVDAATPAAAAETQASDTKLTNNGAVLSFADAARRPSAVFIRGMTAWIILKDAPPLDLVRLKTQLGTFPDSVESASVAGVTQLRVALKQPATIAAAAQGSTLIVTIAPQTSSTAIGLGFARNQENPTHSSISTLLPGAASPLRVVDPVAGDELVVIPAATGRAMASERDYVEFSALTTAAGMVILPNVDDLSVTVDGTRVTITRPVGLSLTPPSMPGAATPESLAVNGEGPCFLDFARWRTVSGGTFLATERRLRAATARLPTQQAGSARLALARFYLANDFAAEALGLINVLQGGDPLLQNDPQLQTLKAAAELQMGRYHEARAALASTSFDNDRHAALWRGLIDVALENWIDAGTELERAAPVLRVYPPEMRARARLAAAEAALGIGRLEIADAELAKLPERLEGRQAVEAALARARLAAAQNHWPQANRLFAAAEGGTDEQLAAQAVYYRVTAGLAAGKLKPDLAVNALERLRFRWRGDALELKTLRKLGQIYFGQKRWRDGLSMLRTATANFPSDDDTAKAQDDMRAAFVDLFLKGKADKMPPVEALALFYDFIELTPIGPDGDEMIRRMSERLVNVDLLGPAADLLNYQVTKRLDGVARAQVATRLAMVQLLDHKPEAVLETLRSTQISTLPDEVAHQRLLMQARAMAELKQYDQALELIAVDKAPDTARLRADIYWRAGDWAQAGQTAEEALGQRTNDAAALSDDERQEVMRAAVAYSMANDEASLERLRSRFTGKMSGTPDASAFAVVADRIDLHGIAFRDAAARIASVDSLKLFLKDLQSRPLATN